MNHKQLRNLPFSRTVELLQLADVEFPEHVIKKEENYLPLYLTVLLSYRDIMEASDQQESPDTHFQASFDWASVRDLMIDDRVRLERKKVLAQFIDGVPGYSVAFEDDQQPEIFYEEWNARAELCRQKLDEQINKLVKY